jgi:membrane fusion protein, multidrug efflux system
MEHLPVIENYQGNNIVNPMKSKFYIIIPIILLAAACSKNSGKEAEKSANDSIKTEKVKVLTLDYEKIARDIEYTATLQAYEELHFSPASPGRIEAIYVEVGNRVSKGTALVQMDRTQLQQAEVQLKSLEIDYRRLDTLKKTGSISIQQYDQLKTQYDIAKSNVDFLRQNTTLRAPFSGVISGKYFEAGEMYTGAPIPSIGKPAVVSLVQMDRLKAVVSISEKYFPLIKQGMEARIVCDVYPDKIFKGRVFRIHPTIDPTNRTFKIEVETANTGGILRPGMFSRVSLDLDKIDAILVPAIAVLKMQGSNDRYVFLEDNGKAKRISVETGKRYNDKLEIISEQLTKGDRIIYMGQGRLVDGVYVEIID